ncbi:hypothetical protein DW035_04685 [Phocaeicola plebeius]|uniref:Uncharacterized protein n=1 Tax=Phocaeicola plebeius TaxID=310297 RepID=A0A415JAC0_9BACT|nr:hypothetical protein DW041_04665 [Phocaeicola plebeius]RHL17405.1 hypothetical protein DW035_04685 [Phocaeicola plebeius]
MPVPDSIHAGRKDTAGFFSRSVLAFHADAPMISFICQGKFYVPASWNVYSSGWNVEYIPACIFRRIPVQHFR